MTAESMLSKRPVLRFTVALFFLLKLSSSHIYCISSYTFEVLYWSMLVSSLRERGRRCTDIGTTPRNTFLFTLLPPASPDFTYSNKPKIQSQINKILAFEYCEDFQHINRIKLITPISNLQAYVCPSRQVF